jgi:hypothetical protein
MAIAADGVPDGRSVVVADMRGIPHVREDLEVVTDPGESPEQRSVFRMFNVVYEADFHIRRTLAGPPLGPDMKVLFIGNPHDRWHDVRVFMVIGRDKSGEPWAASNWDKAEDYVCLSRETIRDLNLASAFAGAEAGEDGSLCIRS